MKRASHINIILCCHSGKRTSQPCFSLLITECISLSSSYSCQQELCKCMNSNKSLRCSDKHHGLSNGVIGGITGAVVAFVLAVVALALIGKSCTCFSVCLCSNACLRFLTYTVRSQDAQYCSCCMLKALRHSRCPSTKAYLRNFACQNPFILMHDLSFSSLV